jgi:hypothetical protein
VKGPLRAVALVLGFLVLVALNVGTAEEPHVPALARPAATGPLQVETDPTPGPAGTREPGRWREAAVAMIDRTTLGAEGLVLPEGASVFAARIVDGNPQPAYVLFEAGGGAFATDFHPASSIKLLAAVGALELAYASDFTGEAIVDGVYSLREYYDAAIRSSSNEDYDALVRLAGVAWLNEQFLPSQGYPATRIQESYAGGDGVSLSPAIQLTEGGRELTLPERSAGDYGCEMANCTTLFDLVDSVRRVVLHDDLPAGERFDIAPADAAGLQEALLGAESWIGPGVREALGPGARLYSKPGWGGDLDCVDIGLVVDEATGRRYLIGVSAPDDGECAMLATMAAGALNVLSRDDDGMGIRSDGSVVPVVDGRQRP